MSEKIPAMMEQIYSIPNLMREMIPLVCIEAKEIAKKLDVVKLKRIFLTGCGDSLGAVLAAKQIFMECTGLSVDVVTTIELSRYYPPEQIVGENENTLVIIVSNSGNVSRAIELAKRVKMLGGTALAITGNKASDLFREAQMSLLLNTPKFHCSGPGLRSYCACLIGLHMLAFSIGEKMGRNNHISALRSDLDAIGTKIENALSSWDNQARTIAENLRFCKSYEFVGAGVNYATAWFGYAKELEVVALPACAINVEDWLHMNYFIRNINETATFVIMNSNSADAGRTHELLKVADDMGRPLVVFTDDATALDYLQSENTSILATPMVEFPSLQSFIQYLPISMIISHLGENIGEEYFRGAKDKWSACIEFATIAKSEQVIIGG